MTGRQVTWFVTALTAIVISAASETESKGTLKLSKLEVPRWADLRGPVTLYCHYDTGGDQLYSVKWYKDEHEFYRYTPGLSPRTLVFNMDGISVDESKSSADQVTLFPLTRSSKGNYKCEVSTDAPNFPTVVEEANMTVIAFPLDGPKIEGLRQLYTLGDYLEANCTAKMTYPKAHVTWYFNEVEVEKFFLEQYDPQGSDDSFFNVTLGVKFPLKKEWVDMNQKLLNVKCVVKVDGVDGLTDEATVRLKPIVDHTLSQERHIFNAGAVVTNHRAFVLSTFVLCYYGLFN